MALQEYIISITSQKTLKFSCENSVAIAYKEICFLNWGRRHKEERYNFHSEKYLY